MSCADPARDGLPCLSPSDSPRSRSIRPSLERRRHPYGHPYAVRRRRLWRGRNVGTECCRSRSPSRARAQKLILARRTQEQRYTADFEKWISFARIVPPRPLSGAAARVAPAGRPRRRPAPPASHRSQRRERHGPCVVQEHRRRDRHSRAPPLARAGRVSRGRRTRPDARRVPCIGLHGRHAGPRHRRPSGRHFVLCGDDGLSR